MRKTFSLLAVLLGIPASLSACGSSSYSGGATSSATTSTAAASQSSAGGSSALVKSASNSTLGGSVLVDRRGLTLYALSGEGAGHLICATSACTGIWHPLTAAGGGTPVGSVGSLGSLTRPDGTRQVTYKGKPLYTFAQDKQAGQAGGQGFKDVGTWEAVKVAAATAPTAPTTTNSPAPRYP